MWTSHEAPPKAELAEPSSVEAAATPVEDAARLKRLFVEHVDLVWRTARRLGLSDAEAEDATQQVFMVASRRMGDLLPGRERAFLLSTTAGVVSNARRSRRRKREDAFDIEVPDGTIRGEELLDRARAQQLAEQILAAMEFDLRTVFVLYELEEMTVASIAETLELPHGTVASRLRRAREEFQRRAARITRQGAR